MLLEHMGFSQSETKDRLFSTAFAGERSFQLASSTEPANLSPLQHQSNPNNYLRPYESPHPSSYPNRALLPPASSESASRNPWHAMRQNEKGLTPSLTAHHRLGDWSCISSNPSLWRYSALFAVQQARRSRWPHLRMRARSGRECRASYRKYRAIPKVWGRDRHLTQALSRSGPS